MIYTEKERQKKVEEITLDMLDRALDTVAGLEMKDVASTIGLLNKEGMSNDAIKKIDKLNDKLLDRVTDIIDEANAMDLSTINSLLKSNRKNNKAKVFTASEEMEELLSEINKEENR